MSATTIDQRIALEQKFSEFEANPIQSRIMKEAGIENPGDSRFIDMVKASLDYCYHAELYLPAPDDPSKPLHLEDWQYQELKYAQYGEAYIAKQKYQNGLLKKFIPHKYFDKDGTPKRKKVAINSPRGFGKSVYSTVVPVEFCLHRPNTKVALFSTSQEQADDLIKKVEHLINNSVLNFMIKNSNSKRISLINGCEIKSFPQSEVTIRGYHPQIKVIDEKSRIKREILESAIRPMGRKTCWLEIGVSTPFGRNNNHYEDCHNPKKFHIRLLNATEVSWVDLAKLLDDKSGMGSRIAAQELYGEFLEDASSVFKQNDIQRMYEYRYDPDSKTFQHLEPLYAGIPGVRYYLGTDFGKNHDYTVFCIGHMDNRGVIVIDYLERHQNMDYTDVLQRIFELTRMYNIKLIIPDGKGVGIAMMDFLVKKVKVPIYTSEIKRNKYRKFNDGTKKPTEKKGFIGDNIAKNNLVGQMEHVVSLGKIKSPYHRGVDSEDESNPLHAYKVLEEEMINFAYQTTVHGNITYSGKEGETKHDDTLMAAMLMVWGITYQKAQAYAMAGQKSAHTYGKGGRSNIIRI
jgi:hypothetical protein